jgi:hypothetical protein
MHFNRNEPGFRLENYDRRGAGDCMIHDRDARGRDDAHKDKKWRFDRATIPCRSASVSLAKPTSNLSCMLTRRAMA